MKEARRRRRRRALDEDTTIKPKSLCKESYLYHVQPRYYWKDQQNGRRRERRGIFRGSSRILESVVLVFQKSKYEYLLGLNRILAQQSLHSTKNEKKSM